jgi:hypothetical protein
MTDTMQKGSLQQPEDQLAKVNGDIAAAKTASPGAAELAGPDGGGGGGSSNDADPVVDGIVTAPVKALAAVTALIDGVEGGNKGQKNSATGGSHYVGGIAGHGQSRAPTPLVPMGYREMVEAAKRARKLAAKLKDKGKDAIQNAGRNVLGRANTAGLSLTGGSLADSSEGPDGQKKGIQIKGLKVTEAAAKGVAILTKLYKERALALQKMGGVARYDDNPDLLNDDLRKNSQRAKLAIKKSPAIRPRTAAT